MFARRLSFWLAVGGVSLLANYSAEALANRIPAVATFTAFAHRGAQS